MTMEITDTLLINGSDAGFFSMFRGTVGTFQVAEQYNANPYVLWLDTLYNEESKGYNAWDYYFEQPSEPDSEHRCHRTQHKILPREYSTRVEMNRLINKYVTVKPHILTKVEEIKKRLDKKTLGIHIRMTDKNNCTKFGEPETGKPVPVSYYINHTHEYLSKNPKSKIFLCTDDYLTIEVMQNNFGNKIIFAADVIRSTGDTSVHHGNDKNGYRKGEEVLVDCLTLARCDHIIKGISNVALCAMFWNLDLTCWNMNSIYNGDTREDFVNNEKY